MFKIALLTCFFLVVQGAESPVKGVLEGISKKCISSTNAPADSFKLLGGKTVPTIEVEQCYLECIYRSMKLIDDKSLNTAVAKTLASNRYKTKENIDNAYKVIDTCSTVKAEEGLKCGLGVAVRRCILDFGQKNNFYLQP